MSNNLLTTKLAVGIKDIENQVAQKTGLKFTNKTKLGEVVSAAIPYFFAATGVALILYIISGGISLMLSLGDPKAVAVARSKILNGILGAIIVTLAYLIVQLTGQLLYLPDFSTLFK